MRKLTLHSALAGLKLIDSKIDKLTSNFEPCGYQMADKEVNKRIAKNEFEKEAQSTYQAITDLIENKIKIKNAIVQANAITKIKIGEKEMTIAEAINYKTIIDLKKALVEKLKYVNTTSRGIINRRNEQVEHEALELAKNILNKDDIRTNDKDVMNITAPYIKGREYKFIDPLKIDKLITDLDMEITEFESEIDAKLSEINAVTFIDI